MSCFSEQADISSAWQCLGLEGTLVMESKKCKKGPCLGSYLVNYLTVLWLGGRSCSAVQGPEAMLKRLGASVPLSVAGV